MNGTMAIEKHYSTEEVASLWGVSTKTVRRIFEDMPGVLKIANPRLVKRARAARVTIRIPMSLLQTAHEERSCRLGAKVEGRRRTI